MTPTQRIAELEARVDELERNADHNARVLSGVVYALKAFLRETGCNDDVRERRPTLRLVQGGQR